MEKIKKIAIAGTICVLGGSIGHFSKLANKPDFIITLLVAIVVALFLEFGFEIKLKGAEKREDNIYFVCLVIILLCFTLLGGYHVKILT